MDSQLNDDIIGEFTLPVIEPDTINDDPWQRDFNVPPMFDKIMVTRTFPLTSIRPTFESSDYSPQELLKSHGFAVLKHRSSLFDHFDQGKLDIDDEELKTAINDIYVPEMTEVMKTLLGAKILQVSIGVLRRGKNAPERFEMPKVSIMRSEDKRLENGAVKPELTRKRIGRGAPARLPHLDQTPLGSRQSFRFGVKVSNEAAIERGIIAAEDEIVKGLPFKAYESASGPLIAEHYNNHKSGKLGPRHAAFSIWRPLKKVERDPLALAPRKEVPEEQGELVYWPYENKGRSEIKADGAFLKEFAMLGVKSKDRPAGENVKLKWYYLPDQDTDEVHIIKLHDSASLGVGAEHAAAPWHGSPEVGNIFGDGVRESLDLRVQVFW